MEIKIWKVCPLYILAFILNWIPICLSPLHIPFILNGLLFWRFLTSRSELCASTLRASSSRFGLKYKDLVPPNPLPPRCLHSLFKSPLSAVTRSSAVAGLVLSPMSTLRADCICSEQLTLPNRTKRYNSNFAAQNTLHLLCLSKTGWCLSG